MKVKLIYVGKENADMFEEAFSFYVKKIKFYISYENIAIPYPKNVKSISEEEQKRKEGELILSKINVGDIVVLLDEKGQTMSSMDFADFLNKKTLSGCKNLLFVIGGAYGFSEKIYQHCHAKISLSKLTFPHILCRLIFAEQLYRALTILHSEPYHHE
jgi:23S rRNA (pseudouridine1915-N3)-methyltransferase